MVQCKRQLPCLPASLYAIIEFLIARPCRDKASKGDSTNLFEHRSTSVKMGPQYARCVSSMDEARMHAFQSSDAEETLDKLMKLPSEVLSLHFAKKKQNSTTERRHSDLRQRMLSRRGIYLLLLCPLDVTPVLFSYQQGLRINNPPNGHQRQY